MTSAAHVAGAEPVHAALARVYGATPGQRLLGLACAGACFALAWALGRQAWLALFGALLAPILLGSAGMAALAALPRARLRWSGAWLALGVLLALGAGLGLLFHRYWTGGGGVGLGADLSAAAGRQVAASSFGVAALVLGLPLWRAQIQFRAQQLARLQQAALAAELKTLQAQIEPHFLYNTLSSTRYLTRHDPDKAGRMLEHLIGYLHSALPDMRADTSTLGREVDLARHYLAVIALRHGERLRVEIDVPAALAPAALPPLMLMTLVENAVKHGLERQPGAVRIGVHAEALGALLRIAVRDDGPGIGKSVFGCGVGLRNLRERLGALYGDGARFELLRLDSGVTEARLDLPLALAPTRAAQA